ncbi:hypothetical protein AYR62_05155 [Secundilactobacillus paracollinoides]|nr:hypothetical protein AYR62_05155 [Secundilactobacillus paracollinoides]
MRAEHKLTLAEMPGFGIFVRVSLHVSPSWNAFPLDKGQQTEPHKSVILPVIGILCQSKLTKSRLKKASQPKRITAAQKNG